ncbi:hypothetical protein GLW07_13945 [Bacillus hwajinpoensis]|uniref:Uncharacterized protein n=1 Tax=Guptibacillus hwajinpoensis TaxID=208199 RepID=A0A845F175_9BACL|nr:hypothetical protein [Pseudalkalibacillus hwajinpoensis]MYL64455.1 hypothetical protein [Pseudalkalibacillus hwajinpoensis]
MGKREISDKEMLAYLRFRTPEDNRVTIIFMVLFFIDFMGFLPSLIGSFSKLFFIAALVPAIILNLWTLVYILAPFKLEKSFHLFIGIFSIVSTYLYWLGIEKIIYIDIGVKGNVPFTIGLFTLVLCLAIFYFYTRYRFQRAKYPQTNREREKLSGFDILVSVAIIMGSNQLWRFINITGVMVSYVQIGLFCLMSFITLHMIGSLHPYNFIRKNIKVVQKVYPDFEISKKERKAQGDIYTIALLKRDELSDRDIQSVTDELGDLQNISSVKKVRMENFDVGGLQNVFQKVDPTVEGIAVIKVDESRLEEEKKKMERTKRWKYFFKKIPEKEYEKVENRVLLDPKQSKLYAERLTEVRAFLLKEKG